MPVLILFLDGVGLGESDPAINPFARVPTPAFHRLLGGPLVNRGVVDGADALLVPTDATLGVAGLPQSATGQTALLTGLNAPAIAGRHVTAYPTEALRALLAQHSLFARARHHDARVALANAYTPEYFSAVEQRRLKVGAVTFAAQSAGVRLRLVEDLQAGQAVFHDLTNGRLRQWGYDLPVLTPRESGGRLAQIASGADLTFFEFFLTDLAAHRRIPVSSDAVVGMVDELLAGVVAGIQGTGDPGTGGSLTVLVVSDHGNLEDDRSTVHTTNPVPTLAIGPGREAFRSVRAITDIAPAVLSVLAADGAAPGLQAAGGSA